MHAVVDSDDKDAEKRSRLDEIRLAIDTNSVGDGDGFLFTQAYVDDYLKMPEIDESFQYLIGWIHELGFAESNGMGAMVISYVSIQAWSQLMQYDISPWSVKVLREMSGAFISMQEKAKKPDCTLSE